MLNIEIKIVWKVNILLLHVDDTHELSEKFSLLEDTSQWFICINIYVNCMNDQRVKFE